MIGVPSFLNIAHEARFGGCGADASDVVPESELCSRKHLDTAVQAGKRSPFLNPKISLTKFICKMASDESLPTLKILMIGPSGAGKSACKFYVPPHKQGPCSQCLVLIRYCDDQFDSESSTATIGVDFKVRHFFETVHV
jgi:hypothetical protein